MKKENKLALRMFFNVFVIATFTAYGVFFYTFGTLMLHDSVHANLNPGCNTIECLNKTVEVTNRILFAFIGLGSLLMLMPSINYTIGAIIDIHRINKLCRKKQRRK